MSGLENIKISVVVPVCDPGAHIDECIASIIEQSLPPGAYEAIFVDDGSVDGTGQRLDELATEHANVHVIHMPRTGSPCAPRNVGIDAARGEYVYFVDDDDWLESTALEELYRYAERHDADVVVGRTVGHDGRRVPNVLFRHDRPRISLPAKPQLLLLLLTPHKLFRRGFLDEHSIRFPEGQRRLEDHHFCLQAYFRAERVAVLASRTCYHWRRRGERSDFHAISMNPAVYYRSLRSVIELVERNTDPGPYRSKLLAHWYGNKILRQVGEMQDVCETRRAVLHEVHTLTTEHFPPSVDAHLSPAKKVRSALLRAGMSETLTGLAAIESGIHLAIRSSNIHWASGTLVANISGVLSYADGTPVEFGRDGTRRHWNLPLVGTLEEKPSAPAQAREASKSLAKSQLDILLRSPTTSANIFLPTEFTLREQQVGDRGNVALEASATARLAPDDDAYQPGAADYELFLRFRSCGWVSYSSLGTAPRAPTCCHHGAPTKPAHP